MATIARQANIRIANLTAPLAQLVINARFAAIVADNFGTVVIDADEFEFTCEWNGHGTNETFTRIDNRDGSEISACEHHADTADVSYIAD
jgi:hypothetical protein